MVVILGAFEDEITERVVECSNKELCNGLDDDADEIGSERYGKPDWWEKKHNPSK